MNKDLIRSLTNPGPAALLVHALDPDTEDPIARISAAQPGPAGACASEIRAGIDAMAVPDLSPGQRQGRSHGDPRGAVRVATGHAAHLRTAPEVEKDAGITSGDLREACAKKRITDAIGLGGRLLSHAATDTHLLAAGLLLYIDRSVLQVVMQELLGSALSDEAKQELIRDLTPRLGLFLSGLAAEANLAGDALAAYRTFAALDRGERVSPEAVAAALHWIARQDEIQAASAQSEDEPPPRRRTKAGKAGLYTKLRSPDR